MTTTLVTGIGELTTMDPEHPVAEDELGTLHNAALVLGTDDHVLWVGSIRAGGEANQIAEQHGDDLALVALPGLGGADWGTAAAAERKPP